MRRRPSTDYETYVQIMGELLRPITAEGLDLDTLKRLYESKLVYLENLRVKCFFEVNSGTNTLFTMSDYALVLHAIRQSREHLHDVVLVAITSNLSRRKVV